MCVIRLTASDSLWTSLHFSRTRTPKSPESPAQPWNPGSVARLSRAGHAGMWERGLAGTPRRRNRGHTEARQAGFLPRCIPNPSEPGDPWGRVGVPTGAGRKRPCGGQLAEPLPRSRFLLLPLLLCRQGGSGFLQSSQGHPGTGHKARRWPGAWGWPGTQAGRCGGGDGPQIPENGLASSLCPGSALPLPSHCAVTQPSPFPGAGQRHLGR